MWCGPPPSRGRQGPQGTDCVPGRKRGKLNADIMVDVPTVGVYACAVVCIRVMLSKQCDAFGREEKNKFLFLTSFITRLRKHNQSRHFVFPFQKCWQLRITVSNTYVSQGHAICLYHP